MTDADAQALIARVLAKGEQLIWSQAAPAIAGPESWLPAVGLTVLAVFMTFVCIAALRSKRPPRMEPWQIWTSFAALGILPAFGAIHFWAQIAGSSATAYGITDRRVIIASRDPWLQVRSFGADDVQMINRRGDTVSIDYGAVSRGDRGYRTHLRRLRDPVSVELLIIEYVRDDPSPQPNR